MSDNVAGGPREPCEPSARTGAAQERWLPVSDYFHVYKGEDAFNQFPSSCQALPPAFAFDSTKAATALADVPGQPYQPSDWVALQERHDAAAMDELLASALVAAVRAYCRAGRKPHSYRQRAKLCA